LGNGKFAHRFFKDWCFRGPVRVPGSTELCKTNFPRSCNVI